MMLDVFDKIASRMRQRTTTAHEAVEAAAKAIASGQAADPASLEQHLYTTGTSLDQFRAICDNFAERVKRFAALDAMGAARRRVDKAEKEIEAANALHAEATSRYQKRHATLRAEAAEAGAIVSAGQAAKDWLLDAANCPPSLREAYADARDREAAAQVALSGAGREVRRLTEEIVSERNWLTQLLGEDAREIHPPAVTITKSGRDKLTASRREKYDDHDRRKTQLEAKLVDANKALEAAQAALVNAEAAVAAVQKQILAV